VTDFPCPVVIGAIVVEYAGRELRAPAAIAAP